MFLSIGHAEEYQSQSPNTWSINTYRSRVGELDARGPLNPRWHENFVFRLAIPTHHCHSNSPLHPSNYPILSPGPPNTLRCTMFSKSKVRAHPFMGSCRVRISEPFCYLANHVDEFIESHFQEKAPPHPAAHRGAHRLFAIRGISPVQIASQNQLNPFSIQLGTILQYIPFLPFYVAQVLYFLS